MEECSTSNISRVENNRIFALLLGVEKRRGGEKFGGLEDKDFSNVAVCRHRFHCSSGVEHSETRRNSASNGREFGRHGNNTRSAACLGSDVSVSIGDGHLSLALKDSINRWANIIVGIVVVILCLVGFAEYRADAYAILILTTRIIVAALIIWLAYKWPKERA
jgi:hypothetical protein